jgi:predicted N-formylglutamate amidohydrolase
MSGAVHLTPGTGAAGLVLTCEHASAELPPGYGTLGLGRDEILDHVGWDIGAAAVARHLAAEFAAPLVESAYSRLLIDCNRDLADDDLIVADSHGVHVPGNRQLGPVERERRIADFYEPYHDAIDRVMSAAAPRLLFSIHSFTPILRGRARGFDVGVLFDDHRDHAETLFAALAEQSFAARRNEPYSGLDGLIFSARSHGHRHGIPYLELEINNGLLRREEQIAEVAARVAAALRQVL